MIRSIFEPGTDFAFKCAEYVPFRDREVCERLRKMSGKELEKHANPDFNIKVMMNPHPVLISTLFERIRRSDAHDKKLTLILGNPEPDTYIPVAQLVNYHRVNCRNVHVFAMDEWADDQDNIAPITYRASFSRSLLKYFWSEIDEDLRMPLENIHYPTNENFADYSKLIAECGDGGADFCSSSPGWTGHMAFVDPVDEFMNVKDMDEYLQQEARMIWLHPLTVAQNSLHGVFGQSGYLQAVPPKAATIGPVDVLRSRERMEVHALLTNGTFSSWQRMVSRLVLHGPVCPQVPSSMLQLMNSQVLVSDELAAPFDCWDKVGY